MVQSEPLLYPPLDYVANCFEKSYVSIDSVVHSLLNDTERMLHQFYTPISTSALHVYHSALVFLPDCQLGTRMQSQGGSLIRLVTPRLSSWGAIIRSIDSHTRSISSIAVSTNGLRIISGSADRKVCVWDINTGEMVHKLTGHAAGVKSVAFSPSNTRIVSGSWDGSVLVWDINTGEMLVHCYQNVKFPSEWAIGLRGDVAVVVCVSFTADEKQVIAGCSDGVIRAWDVSEGQPVAEYRGHTSSVNSTAVLPVASGINKFVSGSKDGTVCIWDVDSYNPIHLININASVICVAASPDATRIAFSDKHETIQVYDAHTGEHVVTIAEHKSYIISLLFSQHGKQIISGGNDHFIIVWDIQTGKEVTRTKAAGAVRSVAFIPNTSRIVFSCGSTISIWDTALNDRQQNDVGNIFFGTSLKLSPDGSRAAFSFASTGGMWNTHTGQIIPREDWTPEKDFGVRLPFDRSPLALDYPIPAHTPRSPSPPQWTVSFDKSSGWICGTYMGDTRTWRLCWIPSDRRPGGTRMLANHGHIIAFSTANPGVMTILDCSRLFSLVESQLKL